MTDVIGLLRSSLLAIFCLFDSAFITLAFVNCSPARRHDSKVLFRITDFGGLAACVVNNSDKRIKKSLHRLLETDSMFSKVQTRLGRTQNEPTIIENTYNIHRTIVLERNDNVNTFGMRTLIMFTCLADTKAPTPPPS